MGDEGYCSDSDVEFEDPVIIVDEYLCVEISYIRVIEENNTLYCCRDCAPNVEGPRSLVRIHYCTDSFPENFMEEHTCSECMVSLVTLNRANDCDACHAFVLDFDLE